MFELGDLCLFKHIHKKPTKKILDIKDCSSSECFEFGETYPMFLKLQTKSQLLAELE